MSPPAGGKLQHARCTQMANGDCVGRTDEIDHFVMGITAAEATAISSYWLS